MGTPGSRKTAESLEGYGGITWEIPRFLLGISWKIHGLWMGMGMKWMNELLVI